METYNLVSFAGIFLLLAFAWVLSADRRRMNWRVIVWGVGMQLVFGALVFWLPAGTRVLRFVSEAVVKVLGCATAGSRFLFGPLALGPGEEGSIGFILATQGLPTVIFFSALISALYYLGVMPLVVRGFAWLFTRLMRISGAEALCAASNIFVGVESALTVRPHLEAMTRSELCTVLTAAMGTVASTVLAVYVFSLQDTFPSIAGHLVSASLLSAPAAVVMSKILEPETGRPETLGVDVRPHYERENSLFEAIINGSMTGLRLLAGIVALLMAVLGLVALVDLVIGGLGGGLNARLGWSVDWSLTGLLGYVFYPFAVATGVPLEDARVVATLLAERTIVTELTAYQHLAELLEEGTLVHGRSRVIAAYALCGFAHVASVGIFVGGIAAVAPSRTRDLARAGPRALLAATLACLLTACVAGAFYTKRSLLLGM